LQYFSKEIPIAEEIAEYINIELCHGKSNVLMGDCLSLVASSPAVFA
jgi:hypothetical protein